MLAERGGQSFAISKEVHQVGPGLEDRRHRLSQAKTDCARKIRYKSVACYMSASSTDGMQTASVLLCLAGPENATCFGRGFLVREFTKSQNRIFQYVVHMGISCQPETPREST